MEILFDVKKKILILGEHKPREPEKCIVPDCSVDDLSKSSNCKLNTIITPPLKSSLK